MFVLILCEVLIPFAYQERHMPKPELAYIYGPYASGKGVLTRLLDGHPELAVTPIHDAFPRILNREDKNVPQSEVSCYLREQLNKTRYCRLEDLHHYRNLRVTAAVDKTSFNSVSIDFYQMEQSWRKEVGKTIPEPLQIIKIIFDALFENWEEYPYDSNECQYYVGMGDRDPQPMERFIEQGSQTKVVYVNRDPRAVVASKGARNIIENESIKQLIKQGMIFDLLQQYEVAKNLSEEYPDRFLIVEFEDLILNYRKEIDRIASFLGIGDDSVLYNPSICGHKLSPKDDYVGTIKDNWTEIISQEERCAAELQMGKIPRKTSPSGVALYIYSLMYIGVLDGYKWVGRAGKRLIS